MYSAHETETLLCALHGHVELGVSGNWDRNICWGVVVAVAVKSWSATPGGWGHGQRNWHPCLEEGPLGWKCSELEEQHHGLRTAVGSLPADASAVDMDLYDAQTLAEALKWYLQELPSPLIPPALYSDLVHMAQGRYGRAPPTPGTFVGLEEL